MERILIRTGDSVASEIRVGPDVLGANLLPMRESRRRVAIVTQPSANPVAMRIASILEEEGLETAVRLLPDREAAKTLEVAEECFLWMNELALTRSDTLVAVGGGAATDVGGFIGATYLRGVETVLVPTTLLAAVDAAIGGKTAVNVGGKNLAGVFSHPARVLVSTEILAELPRNLLIEGTAEAVKAGFIADEGLIEIYEEHGLDAPLDEVVARAIRVKAEVVNEDFTEQGRRAILNYGHTVGHAIEHVTKIPHGHAVAIGMVAAGAASAEVAGFQDEDRQKRLIQDLDLPVASPEVDQEEIWAAMQLDKKRDESGMRMVLLEGFGQPVVMTVDPTTVRAALNAVGIG